MVDATIDDLDMASLIYQLHIFAPQMQPLTYICTIMDNTTSQGWSNGGSTSSAMSVSPIPQDLSLLTHRNNIYSSFGRLKG